jgi:hypothetical protein
VTCPAAWVLAATSIFNVTLSLFLVRASRIATREHHDQIDAADSFRRPIRRSPAEVIS